MNQIQKELLQVTNWLLIPTIINGLFTIPFVAFNINLMTLIIANQIILFSNYFYVLYKYKKLLKLKK